MTQDNNLRKQIYNNMNFKATDELVEIWKTNNRLEWSDISFDIIKEIIEHRLGELPPQEEPITDERMARKILQNTKVVSLQTEEPTNPKDNALNKKPESKSSITILLLRLFSF